MSTTESKSATAGTRNAPRLDDGHRTSALDRLSKAANCLANDIIGCEMLESGSVLRVQVCERRSKGSRRGMRTVDVATSSLSVSDGKVNFESLVNGTSKRKLLAIINPVSGAKRGEAIWRNRCLPILSACPQIDVKEIITGRSGQATDIAAQVDLKSCDGIVAVGGDGILYEIISGILQRSDWETASKLPLGIVPAGSGNGLALSILHQAGETWDAESMAYLIAKGGVEPMDLLSMDSPSMKQAFSFLSTEWALASDIDITSEKYRCCGSFRFTCRALELVYCDGCVRNYTGTLHYLPLESEASHSAAPADVEIGASKSSNEPSPTLCGNGPTTGASRLIDTRTMLPSISNPIGDEHRAQGWKTLEGADWKYLWAMQTTHQASDSYGAPESKLSDGIIYICIAKDMSCCVPCKMTQWLLAMEDGNHLKMKDAKMIKCKAFRLEPENGIVAIDGERVACEPTQGEVHKGFLRVMA